MENEKLDGGARSRLEQLLADRRPKREAPGEDEAPKQARVTPRHIVVAGLVLAVVVVAASWSVLGARSTTLAPALVTPPVTPLAATAIATPTPTAAPRVTVHVVGAVHRPGLVQVADGARVAEALDAAGGLRPDADAGDLNLAERVPDGSQIKVGTTAQPAGELRGATGAGSGVTGGAGGGAAEAKLDLNQATAAQLEQLPGVGPVMAGRIVAWRQQHGRFSRVEELQEVDGVGPKTYAQLAGLVRV